MKIYVIATFLLLAIAALVVAGCGGSASGGTGKEQFVSACGGCHELKAAGTKGKTGPNLDDAKPSEKRALNKIEKGGNGMPKGLLTGKDAMKVAKYVSNAAGQ